MIAGSLERRAKTNQRAESSRLPNRRPSCHFRKLQKVSSPKIAYRRSGSEKKSKVTKTWLLCRAKNAVDRRAQSALPVSLRKTRYPSRHTSKKSPKTGKW